VATTQQVVFVQGGGEGVHDDWDARLVISLSQELGSAYDVRYPRMPQEADPEFASWSAIIEQEIAAAEDGVIVVGHSVGGTILVNHLARAVPRRRLGAIALIAAPFVGSGGWPGDEFGSTEDLGATLPDDVPVHVVHGLDDDIVPPEHAALYQRAIPQARLHLLPGRDHQFKDDLADVARVLRS
jgi:predicted alpha/beta hydrolase family esterase